MLRKKLYTISSFCEFFRKDVPRISRLSINGNVSARYLNVQPFPLTFSNRTPWASNLNTKINAEDDRKAMFI